jgi:tetratricopeptide (TPR) repeat protein
MRKDRSERYRSAVELADDIGNYLKGVPLMAGPLSTTYRLSKFVRRNRVLVSGIIAVTLTLTSGLFVSTSLYLRAEGLRVEAQEARRDAEQAAADARSAAEKETAAREEAERAANQAQKIADFLERDFIYPASQIKGREPTVLDLLGAASAAIESAFIDQPAIEKRIRGSLAKTYDALGNFRGAVSHSERIYQIQEELREETMVALNWRGVAYYRAGDYTEAARSFERAIQARNRSDRGVPVWLKFNLATAYARQSRYEQAEQLFAEVMDPNWWDPAHPEHIRALASGPNLARMYTEQGRYVEAEEMLVTAVKGWRKKHRAGTAASAGHLVRRTNDLGRLYIIQGRYDDASALFEEGIAVGGSHLSGKDHPYTLRHVHGLGVLRAKQGRYEEAETHFKRALEGGRLKLGEGHPYTLETINELGVLRREQKDYAEAERLLRQALEGRELKLGADHPHTLTSMHELALVYIGQEGYDKAKPLLLDAYHGRETKLGPQHPHTVDSLRQLVTLHEAWSKPEEAEKWRVKLPKTGADAR